jgi:calcineurin-like phosphoesterase
MTGPYDSVIGVQKEQIITRFLKNLPMRFEAATGNVKLCGALIDCDEATGRATAIERLMVDQVGK